MPWHVHLGLCLTRACILDSQNPLLTHTLATQSTHRLFPHILWPASPASRLLFCFGCCFSIGCENPYLPIRAVEQLSSVGWAGRSELVAPVAAWQWPAGQGSTTVPLGPERRGNEAGSSLIGPAGLGSLHPRPSDWLLQLVCAHSIDLGRHKCT